MTSEVTLNLSSDASAKSREIEERYPAKESSSEKRLEIREIDTLNPENTKLISERDASNERRRRGGDSRLRERAQVDQQLQKLMKQLGDAINESLSDSDQIAEVISRIKSGG